MLGASIQSQHVTYTNAGAQLLAALGLPSSTIAAAISTSGASITSWIGGGRMPPPVMRSRLQVHYGIPVEAWLQSARPGVAGPAAPSPAAEPPRAKRRPPSSAASQSQPVTEPQPPRVAPPAPPALAPPKLPGEPVQPSPLAMSIPAAPPAPPPAPVAVPAGATPLDQCLATLAELRSRRGRVDLSNAEEIRIADLEVKYLALQAKLEETQFMREDRIVREHPEYQRLKRVLVKALTPIPGALAAVKQALQDELTVKGGTV